MNNYTVQLAAVALTAKALEDSMKPTTEMISRLAEEQMNAFIKPFLRMQEQIDATIKPILKIYEQTAAILNTINYPLYLLGCNTVETKDPENEIVEKLKKTTQLREIVSCKESGFEIYGQFVEVKTNTNHALLLRALIKFEGSNEVINYEVIEEFFRIHGKPQRSGEKRNVRIRNAKAAMLRFIEGVPKKLSNGGQFIEVIAGKGLKFNNSMGY